MIYNPNEIIEVPKIGMLKIGVPKISMPNVFGSVVRENKKDDSNTNKMGYIKDDLVFHLDGINKGNNPDAWTDLVGGIVFENHGAVPTYDGWEFNDNNADYLEAAVGLKFPYDTSTIEITFIDNSNKDSRILFQTGIKDSLSFGILSKESVVTYQSGDIEKYKNLFLYKNLKINRISCTKDISVQNGVLVNKIGKINSWNIGQPKAIIGKRNSNNPHPFNGKIYSIRIYDRLLTEEEMLHNQAVDYKRFDLANVAHDYAVEVINSLKEVKTPQNIVFSSMDYNTLTEEEIALATSKGWSVVSA